MHRLNSLKILQQMKTYNSIYWSSGDKNSIHPLVITTKQLPI